MLEARRKEQREALQQKQAGRRFTLEGEAKALTARQRQAGYDLAVRQKEGTTVLRQAYLQETIRRNPRNVAYCETVQTYCGLSPSASNCRVHSAGASRSRSTPMPRGRRPSTAALTRSGARNASETVKRRRHHRGKCNAAYAAAQLRNASSLSLIHI